MCVWHWKMYLNIDIACSSRLTPCICWGRIMSLQAMPSLILLHTQNHLKRGPPLQCTWSVQNNRHRCCWMTSGLYCVSCEGMTGLQKQHENMYIYVTYWSQWKVLSIWKEQEADKTRLKSSQSVMEITKSSLYRLLFIFFDVDVEIVCHVLLVDLNLHCKKSGTFFLFYHYFLWAFSFIHTFFI